MVTKFSSLMGSVHASPGAAAIHVPDDWAQGRTSFGGLQVALALRAMRTLVPAMPLRSLQATFFAPIAAGPSRAEATVVRAGKNTMHVEARVRDGDATALLVIAVFGWPRASSVEVVPRPAPLELEATHPPIELRYVPGLGPSFVQHFRTRFLLGSPPFAGTGEHRNVIEVDFVDDGPTTEAHIVAFADFIPPIALSHLRAPAAGSSLTWMLELVGAPAEGLPLAGWRIEAELMAAREGYTHQSVRLFGPGGVPVALSRQTMVVFG